MNMTKTDSNTSVFSSLDRAPKHPLGSILVDIDTSAGSQPALDLAGLLARRSGALLRIVDVSTPDPAARIERRSPHSVLLEEAERYGYDLVIRSQDRDGKEDVNRQLFRHSPCPVWAVAPRPKLHRPRILVAVDPVSPDPVTKALDAGALRFALRIRGLLNGEITIFHAWNQPAEKKLRRYPAQAESSIRATEGHAADLLLRFVSSFGPGAAGSRIELGRGAVEEVVRAFVVSEGIDIVIAGAPARTGISRLLFGSTAERLLDAAPCSVIAFKQPAPFDTAPRA
jgi:nucleotide-binding universal stress UspA family protein